MLAALILLTSSHFAASEPVLLRYREDALADRYIFSQTGWMDPPGMTKGNIFTGYLELRPDHLRPGAIVATLTDLAVAYTLANEAHVKQPSDSLVGVPVRLQTSPGQGTRTDLDPEAATELPFLPGILPSNLRTDIPEALPMLPANPVAPGDQWTDKHNQVLETKLEAGSRMNPGASDMVIEHRYASEIHYQVDAWVDHPAAFQSRDRIRVLKISGQGRGTVHSVGPVNGEFEDSVTMQGHFDPDGGRWLDLTIQHAGPGVMRMPNGERKMEMGYTNHYIYVSSSSGE